MIDDIIAGAFTGLLLAAITVAVGPILLFRMAKNPTPFFRSLLERVPPIYMTMGIVVMAYPVWTVVGVATGILYGVSVEAAPGGGLGSSNLVFTVAATAILVMMAAPFAVLLKNARLGIGVTTLVLVGMFGWLLPFLAR
jgi:hypothetical protein